jgi:hypothetical protein
VTVSVVAAVGEVKRKRPSALVIAVALPDVTVAPAMGKPLPATTIPEVLAI